MKHGLRRFIAVSVAALTMISAMPARYGTKGIIRAVTASAATTIESGAKGVTVRVSSNATLYFYFNRDKQSFEVCGSTITGDNVEVTIPDTVSYNGKEYIVTAIRPYAFCNQTNLVKIYGSSEYITSIGQGAFYGCYNLTKVDIYEYGGYSAIEYIGPIAFEGCSSLVRLNVLEGNKAYDSRNKCNAIIESATNTLVIGCRRSKIPEGIRKIERFSFEGREPKEIYIPKSVKEGIVALSNCETIYIPKESEGSELWWDIQFAHYGGKPNGWQPPHYVEY